MSVDTSIDVFYIDSHVSEPTSLMSNSSSLSQKPVPNVQLVTERHAIDAGTVRGQGEQIVLKRHFLTTTIGENLCGC